MLIDKKYFVSIGLVLVLVGLVIACRSTPPLATPSAPGISVGITSDICPNVEVGAGQQVTWTNQDRRELIVQHKPIEGNSEFDSGTLQPGDSFALTLAQPGSYTYECSTDGSMIGTLTIQP